MRVDFEKIKIEGFMSVGEVELDLNNKNLVLVEGKNQSLGSLQSNGSGKSCIFEAIYWALTGKTVRGAKEVINRYYGRKYASVKLLLKVNDDEYLLSRYKEHPDHGNNLLINKNGNNISGSSIRKSEQILSNELPFLTEDLIGSVIILGQGMPSRFTNYDPSGRKEILEVLSGNLGIMDQMKEKLLTYRNSLSEFISKTNIEIHRLESAIALRKKDIEKLQELQTESPCDVDELKKELSSLVEQRTSTSEDMDKYENLLNTIKNDLATISSSEISLNFTLKQLVSDINNYKSELTSFKDKKCPTCNQDLLDQEWVEKRKSDLEISIKTKEKDVSETEKELSGIKDNLTVAEGKKQKLEDAYKQQKSFTQHLEYSIMEKQNKLQSARDFVGEIKKLEEEVRENDDTVYDLAIGLNVNLKKEQIADYLLREIGRDFRGYLLKGIVDYLNVVLKEFSTFLFGRDSLGIVLEDNKIYIEYEGRSYESLSGGEKHRADLAMQFALREMLMKDLGYTFNILVLDEIFDNLDESGVEALIKFLTSNLGEIDSVFVVTHHPALDIPFDSKITAIKGIDNVTEVMESY